MFMYNDSFALHSISVCLPRAQVLDNDVFAAFEETGNVFDAETAEKARKYIYSAGNTVAPQKLFRAFRGRDPEISFFLKNRGLV
jgi:peptidyl-dipeptidase Dcp